MIKFELGNGNEERVTGSGTSHTRALRFEQIVEKLHNLRLEP